MTVTYFRSAQIPSFICSSTDMSGSKVSGISVPGAHVFFTDTQKEYIVNSDLTLVPYIFNTSSSGSSGGSSGSAVFVTNFPASGSSVQISNFPTTQVVSGSASEYHLGEIGGRMTAGSVEFTNTSGSGTAYSIGDTVSAGSTVTIPYEIPNMFRVAGGSGYVVSLGVSTNKSSITPNFRVHFYSGSSVTLSGDNLPYLDSYAANAYKLNPFDLPVMASSTNTSGSLSRTWDTTTIRQACVAQPGSTSLWVALEALAAFTPAASSEKYTISAIMDNN